MGSDTPLKLPTIDFSNPDLSPGSPSWDSTRALVKQAFEECGGFEISFDKVPLEIRKALFASLDELFDLPVETKKRNVATRPYNGYAGQAPGDPVPGMPRYESLGIQGANIPDEVLSFAQLMWPQGNPNFCKSVTFFSQQLAELDLSIRRMVLESLGVDKYFDELKDSTSYLLRAMKYEAPQSTDAQLGLNPHTDKNMMTILYQNQVEGLQVQTKQGDWISVKPTENSFLVIAGESFYAWTNGRVHPANHRVTMSGNEARYSLGFFVSSKPGIEVKAPEELVDDEHPLLFKPFDYDKFLEFYSRNLGNQAVRECDAMKAYCGM